jgi:MFS transporter, MHS family, proline/betaine transporter
MAIPTFLIGILPGYEVLGVWAPALLVLLRLIQGTSIGGEGAGSAIFVLEHNKNLKLGMVASIVTASNFVGAFCATLVGLSVSFFALDPSAWRWAFVFGGVLGLLGFYLRVRALETPIFQKMAEEKRTIKIPFLNLISKNKKQILLSCCLGGVTGSIAYMVLAYVNVFFNKTMGLDPSTSLFYATLGIGSFITCLPIFGFCSDRLGYHRVLVSACYAIAVLAIPLFMMMARDTLVLIPVLVLGLLGAWLCAPAYPLMLQMFSPQQRYSGIAFSFNLGIALFGGTTPIVSAFLIKKVGLNYAPSFYLVILAVLFIACYSMIYKKIPMAEN